MNTYYLRHVRQLFANYHVSETTRRVYQRKWVRAVRNLGPNWVLHESNSPKNRSLSS